MDYIVLDLEWNQAPGKFDKETMLPFEIVEIGAVKLNSKFEKQANLISSLSLRFIRQSTT